MEAEGVQSSQTFLMKNFSFLQLLQKLMISALSSVFWVHLHVQIVDLKQLPGLNKMYIITSKCNSAFGMIGEVSGTKMTANVVDKNSSFHISMKN